MTTSLNSTIPGRDNLTQNVQSITFTVAYSETNIATGVNKATLPEGAIVIGTDVLVTTAFNAGSTNVFTVGTNSTPYDNLVAAADVDETTAAFDSDNVPTGTAYGVLSAAASVYAKYTQTGTAATTGAARVVIKYITT